MLNENLAAEFTDNLLTAGLFASTVPSQLSNSAVRDAILRGI